MRKQPRIVLESYLAKGGIYTSPFKLLITLISAWIIVSNFFIDWYKVWEGYLMSLDNLYKLYIDHHAEPTSSKTIQLWSKFAGDLVSKYFLYMILLVAPLQAYISYKLCKPYMIGFKTHFAVSVYILSLGVLTGFAYIILIAINFWLAVFVGFVIMVLPLIGLKRISNLLSIVPVNNFFVENGLAIEKNYARAKNIIGIFIAILVAAIFVYLGKNQ